MDFSAVPRRLAAGSVSLVAAVCLSGCASIPADSEGLLERARGGTLVVGVSEHEPWTVVADDGTVSGTEASLVTDFAGQLDADVEWEVGPESVLVDKVATGEVDVLIGGLTTSSPWSSDIAFTRPYTEVVSDEGQKQKMVMGTPRGENAFLVALERHLAHAHGEIQ